MLGGDPLTAGLPLELGRQPHEHLHDGHQLDVQLQAQLGLGDDEEGGGSEERDVVCRHRGPGLSGRGRGLSGGGAVRGQGREAPSPAERGSWV